MSTQRTAAKKAPGRPRKAPEDKLEQFSVRLPPKLKFGLELLARAQHRSLSQAVEWAVQVGLNSYEADRDGTSLGRVLDDAWAMESPEERLLAIYRWVPMLLSFEDAAVCEVLVSSHDRTQLWSHIDSKERSPDERKQLEDQLERNYWGALLPHWADIQAWAVEEANAGRSLQGRSIARHLKIIDKHIGTRRGLWGVYEDEAKEVAAKAATQQG